MMPMIIQILRWLKQSEAWRFVGFVSTVVGLLCYALSSSFEHLFGERNWLKIFLYSIFSFIICFMILFAKVWQHSRSLLSKAHVAVLVLTATSVYSFFYDKAVNRKPDAYSLISCVAFAIMSLSLSRQTHLGCEVDLLYFFLGCLMIQLMKINEFLGIVGACFSYSLISLRSFLDVPLEIGYLGLQDQGQQHVVIQLDSQQQQANAISSDFFMPQLMAGTDALRQKHSDMIRMLFEQLKEYLASSNRSKKPVTDHNFLMDALPDKIINDIHYIAKFMVAAGFEKECCEVYISCRKEFLKKCLTRLFGLQQRMLKTFERLELEDYLIGRWNEVLNVTLRILFPSEQRLCDHIFFGFSAAAGLHVIEVFQEATIHLLSFAEAVVSGRPSTWRLFNILKMFETLEDLIPEFESLFSESMVKEAIRIQNRLAEAVSNLFLKFSLITFHNPAVKLTIPADGRVHPMTLSVMRDLHSVLGSRKTLEQILQEYPPKGADRVETSTLISVQVVSLMELLEIKLKAKSNVYKDLALRCLFMMNNRRYVEQQANEFGLGILLGENWIQNNAAKVQQNLELYQRSSWNNVLDFLKLDNYESVATNVAAESMKEKLNLFNMHFKEMLIAQSTWCVPDKQLREEIRTSLGNILLPAYGNFIGRFQDVLGKQAYEYIKYGMFDIEAKLNHLFL